MTLPDDDQRDRAQELARLVFDTLAAAGDALTEEERSAYKDAQESVVEARRHAEIREGLLRIN